MAMELELPEDFRTPAFLILKDRAEKNCLKMANIAKRFNVKLRPHVKSHKTIEGARMQLHAIPEVASGIVVSTLAEARFFAVNGFDDILYAVPISADKLTEAKSLHKQLKGKFQLLVDHPKAVDFCAANPPEEGKWLLWLKVDTGTHRAGVQPRGAAGLSVLDSIKIHGDTVELAGLYAHQGNSYAAGADGGAAAVREAAAIERDEVLALAKRLQVLGYEVPEVAIGSTPTCSNPPDSLQGITEMHPGNYMLYDAEQSAFESCTHDECAGLVVTRVLSHYEDRNMMLVDAGALALSKDKNAKLPGYGVIAGHPELTLASISQEVGRIVSDKPIPFDKFPLGSFLYVIPSHICLAAACHDVFHVVEGGHVVGKWTPCRGW